MKVCLLFVLIFQVLQITAQDFIQSPYQNFGLSNPILADFDGDDKLDVFGIQYTPNPNRAALQINNGVSPIAFTEKNLNLNLDVMGQPEAADFDGDLDMDLIIAAGAAFHLVLLQNDGNANFTIDSLGVSGSSLLKATDTDLDGDLDIIGINPDNNSLTLYLNDGSQTFSSTNILTSSDDLVAFDISDMDNDGDIDIVLGFDQFSGNQMLCYKNIGVNNFEQVVLVANGISSLESLVVDDINSDGKNDIIAISGFGCDGFLNQSNLTFVKKGLIGVSNPVRSLRTGDFNGDGRKDIVIGTNSSNITWHKNLSNTTLAFESHVVGGVAPAYNIVNGDIDNDGDEDLVVSNGEFWWYENNIEQQPSSTISLNEKEIAIFPNPFTDVVQLKNLDLNLYNVELFDAFGGKINTPMISFNAINLAYLKPGAYFLQFINKETLKTASVPLIKME